jgi:DNA-binding FrmR family transcriptional regulator
MSSTQITPGIAEDAPRAAVHDPEATKKIANRLRRAHGQLAAVIGAVESGEDCRTVVQQLSAVTKALDRAGFLVISTALRECLADPSADGAPNPEELEKLFLSLA